MPMYEFSCQACSQPFEKNLRMSQVGEIQICPDCGSQQTRRRFSVGVAVSGGNRTAVSTFAQPVRSPFT